MSNQHISCTNLGMEKDNNNFFIIEEKNGTHSAILKFANFISREDAQDLIDSIVTELGYVGTIIEPYTKH